MSWNSSLLSIDVPDSVSANIPTITNSHVSACSSSVYNRGQRVPSEDKINWIVEKSKEFYLVGKLDEALEIENQLSRTMKKTRVFTTKDLYGVLRIIANDGEEYFGKVIKYTI